MLKKITEPQAQYIKEHDGQTIAPMSSAPQKNSKRTLKIVGGALAAVLFLVVGVAGILVSQRQQQVAGPVAPNAPSSRPAAAGDACALTFTVAEETIPTPVTGTAQCGSKSAYLVKANGTLEKLEPNAVVAPGSIIEYHIPVTATAQTTGQVKLSDKLDVNTTFDAQANQPTSDATIAHSGGTVTITFPAFTSAGQKFAKYRVKVATKVQPFTFTNTVAMTDIGNGQPSTEKCTMTLKTAPTGTASCQSKTAYTLDANDKVSAIADKQTVLRGSQFYYTIKVQATGAIPDTNTVTVKDTLPAGITYLEDAKNTAGLTKSVVNGRDVVTKVMPDTFGDAATEDAPEVQEITFKVQVADTIAPGTFENTVAVTTGTATTDNTCKHTVEVKPDGAAQCVNKQMHTAALSENKPASQTLISDGTNLDRNHVFYYRVKLKADRLTTGKVTITDSLPAALEVVDTGDFKLENGKYVTSYDAFQGEKVAEIKVKVKSGYFDRVDNSVSVTTTGTSGTASTCGSYFNIPTYDCDTTCDNDDQCKSYNDNHICANTSEGKRCRLATNTSSSSCQATSTSTPTPTPTPTSSVSTPTPTPTVGCNSRCSTNADCANTAHICYQTTDGGRCRLDSNVTSTTCSLPVAQATPTPITETQPVVPEELPQTGPEDWGNWLKAGLVTLGIGAVLLLLL